MQFSLILILQVLEKGELKQFDKPNKLIEDEKGLFYSMVQQTGERERIYINHMLTCQTESTRL